MPMTVVKATAPGPRVMQLSEGGEGSGLSRLDKGLPSRDVAVSDTRRDRITGGTCRKRALGRDGMEFFPAGPIFSRYFPFRWQVGPDSKLTACYPEIVERRFSVPVPLRIISSHVHCLQCRHASRPRRPRQKGPKQVNSAAVIPQWYAGITWAGKRQVSSNPRYAIALSEGSLFHE